MKLRLVWTCPRALADRGADIPPHFGHMLCDAKETIMGRWTLTAAAMACIVGCTNISLERRTVNQAISVTAFRYQEVLDNLALVSANRGALPSFSIIGAGGVSVADMAKVDSTTVWDGALRGFNSEALTLGASRSPDQSWTLDPVASQPQLEALRCACLWVLCGPPDPASDCMALLGPPVPGVIAGYHFDVADQLGRIPPGWLRTGCRRDVPTDACYVGHHGERYVWVMPDGLVGLSEFTLVLMDIATVDPTSLQLQPAMATVESQLQDKPSRAITDLRPAKQDAASDGTPGRIIVAAPTFDGIPAVALGDVGSPVTSPKPQIIMPRLLQQQSLINQPSLRSLINSMGTR
jgi:hypothetical protein